MSIKQIARELYRLKGEVEALERRFAAAAPPQREALEKGLGKLKAERNRLQGMLEGAKEPPSYRLPR